MGEEARRGSRRPESRRARSGGTAEGSQRDTGQRRGAPPRTALPRPGPSGRSERSTGAATRFPQPCRSRPVLRAETSARFRAHRAAPVPLCVRAGPLPEPGALRCLVPRGRRCPHVPTAATPTPQQTDPAPAAPGSRICVCSHPPLPAAWTRLPLIRRYRQRAPASHGRSASVTRSPEPGPSARLGSGTEGGPGSAPTRTPGTHREVAAKAGQCGPDWALDDCRDSAWPRPRVRWVRADGCRVPVQGEGGGSRPRGEGRSGRGRPSALAPPVWGK